MPELNLMPPEIAALAPKFAKLGESLSKAGEEVSQVAGAAERAVSIADVASALHEFAARWRASLHQQGEDFAVTSRNVGAASEAYCATEHSNCETLGGP